ncbi:peptide methionine sulfoxide reductase MsrA [Boletus reticuloceps]|uniref:peptide-methionine (S)-S-oxide reductase n=1 Tax=Boletus reticuloceps TaxID=495285 RepID=A0A8I2YM65_9AGAM|nr:peptide methionine sulfoxide reductase MsrA [Boletus reticuloceps]
MFSRLKKVRTGLASLATKASSTTDIDQSHYRSETSGSQQPEVATFAAGCFWGAEYTFLKYYPPSENKGILKTAVGFAGGKGSSNHAEAVRIEFDPSIVTYDELVEFFHRMHDPTTPNRQGGDIGALYRSAIFTHSPEQASIARRVTEEVQAKHFTPKGKQIVTEIAEAGAWYDAEDKHQLYLIKNSGGYLCSTHRLHW